MENDNISSLRDAFGKFGDFSSEQFTVSQEDNCIIDRYLERAYETAPQISCSKHQNTLLRDLEVFIDTDKTPITFYEVITTTKHADNCQNQKCFLMHQVSTLKYSLNPKTAIQIWGDNIAIWSKK